MVPPVSPACFEQMPVRPLTVLQRYKASVQVLCTPPHSTTWPTHTVVVVQQTPLKRGIILWELPKESASQPASLPHLPKPPHGSCDFITQPTRGPIRAQLAAISISCRAWLSVWHPHNLVSLAGSWLRARGPHPHGAPA
jgi:hypothetical protein